MKYVKHNLDLFSEKDGVEAVENNMNFNSACHHKIGINNYNYDLVIGIKRRVASIITIK